MLYINDYKYSLSELEPWAARVKKIAEDAQETYAVTNNHNLGKAVLNAVELKALLFGGPVSAPAQLVETYPELKDLALVPES